MELSVATVVRGRFDIEEIAFSPVSSGHLSSVSVILPAHNEEGNIEAVILHALEVMPEVADQFEIVVVDDGSTDRTGPIAEAVAADRTQVRVVHHPRNLGYGNAWRTGIRAASGDWIFFMDSDRQFDIAEISKLAQKATDHDIVAGYRIHRRDPYYRFLVGSCFNILVTLLFDVHLRDIDCGFKMFRSYLLKPMELESPGALINTEIHAKANRVGARMAEVGINHYPREIGRQSGTKFKVMASALAEIVRLRWRLRRYSTVPIAEAMAQAGR